MDNNEYDQIEKYINSTGIDDNTRRLISDFTILWNRYEKELYNNSYSPKKLRNTIEKYNYSYCSILISNCFEEMTKYIEKKTKYSADELSSYFNMRSNDIKRDELERIMNGKNDIDKLCFLLLIAARVRNNMFHGLKELKELNNQRKLFEICNIVLKMVLDAKSLSMLNVEFEVTI